MECNCNHQTVRNARARAPDARPCPVSQALANCLQLPGSGRELHQAWSFDHMTRDRSWSTSTRCSATQGKRGLLVRRHGKLTSHASVFRRRSHKACGSIEQVRFLLETFFLPIRTACRTQVTGSNSADAIGSVMTPNSRQYWSAPFRIWDDMSSGGSRCLRSLSPVAFTSQFRPKRSRFPG